MKKISAILISALLLVSLLLPMSVNAEGQKPFAEIGDIKLENKAPTVDGKIDAGEGWSEKKTMNEMSTGSFLANNSLTSETDLYFAYTEEGLYFGASMKEYGAGYTLRFYEDTVDEATGETVSTWAYSISYIDENAESYDSTNYPENTPDGTHIDGALLPPAFDTPSWRENTEQKTLYWTNSYGNTVEYSTSDDTGAAYVFDGDVFALSLDMLGIFHDNKLTGSEDYAPQYNVGIFEGNEVKVATSRYSPKDITSDCKAAGKIDGNTLVFEVMIPWTQIIADSNEAAQGFGISHTYTKEEILNGSNSWAAVTLMDRFNDPEAGYVDDWGRTITVCNVAYSPEFPDGVPGAATSGSHINGMGIHLLIGENTQNGGSDVTTNGGTVTDENGKVVNGGGSTTTKAASTNKGNNKGGSSANTFDAGLAVAVGALATSAIGVYFSKKKR